MLGTPVPEVFLRIPVERPAREVPFILVTVRAVAPVASPVCVALETFAVFVLQQCYLLRLIQSR